MKKVEIIAHRGGFLPEGPVPKVQSKYTIPENTLAAFKRAFENGWGIETDVRIINGQFVLSHNDVDLTTPTLDELCQLTQRYQKNGHTPFIAFQIKRGSSANNGVEIGKAIAKRMQQCDLKNSILFDATFEEAQILHREFPWLNLSVSVGEEKYSPTIYTPDQVFTKEFIMVFNGIWADEWKISGSIYNEEIFKKLRDAYSGRIDVISPELHYNENHPLSKDLAQLKALWGKIVSWGLADGICTDYPSKLEIIL